MQSYELIITKRPEENDTITVNGNKFTFLDKTNKFHIVQWLATIEDITLSASEHDNLLVSGNNLEVSESLSDSDSFWRPVA